MDSFIELIPAFGDRETLALAVAVFALVAFLTILVLRRDRAKQAVRLSLVGRAASDVIYDWDMKTGELAVSEAVSSQLGYEPSRKPLARAWWEERLHPEDSGPVREALKNHIKGRQRDWEMEYRFRKADGTYTTVHDRGSFMWSGRGPWRRPTRMFGTLFNVDSVALYDRVTSLAGRALFADRVERRSVTASIAEQPFAVIVIDLARFKGLIATIGNERVNEILGELARRLETHLLEGESIARIGHDQFAFLVNESTADDALARAGHIRDITRLPFKVETKKGTATLEGAVRLDIIGGIAVLAPGSEQDLMRQAQAALADAKRTRSRIAVYEPGGDKRWEERVALRNDLASALTRKELVLYYQPIADAKTGRTVAVEALLRWKHPERGVLDARELLEVVADLDVGPELDRWVLGEAARAIAGLRQIKPDLRLAVNLSAATIDDNLPVSLRSILASALIPSESLILELPEDPTLASGKAPAVLAELRNLGVEFAIDDIGTGYSSVASEPLFPANELKIDSLFAGRVMRDAHAKHTVRAAVERAHELGMRVVGEGVEDSETRTELAALGVDLVQGRGIAAPLPLQSVAQLLAPLGASVQIVVTPPKPLPGFEQVAAAPASAPAPAIIEPTPAPQPTAEPVAIAPEPAVVASVAPVRERVGLAARIGVAPQSAAPTAGPIAREPVSAPTYVAPTTTFVAYVAHTPAAPTAPTADAHEPAVPPAPTPAAVEPEIADARLAMFVNTAPDPRLAMFATAEPVDPRVEMFKSVTPQQNGHGNGNGNGHGNGNGNGHGNGPDPRLAMFGIPQSPLAESRPVYEAPIFEPTPPQADPMGWVLPDTIASAVEQVSTIDWAPVSVPAAVAAVAPASGVVAPEPVAPHAAATETLMVTPAPGESERPAVGSLGSDHDPRAAVLAALRKAAEEELAELRRASGNEQRNSGDERPVLLGKDARGQAVRSVTG